MEWVSYFPPNILIKIIDLAAFKTEPYNVKWNTQLRLLCRKIRDYIDKNQCPVLDWVSDFLL